MYILSAWNSGRKVLQGVEITDASSTRAFVDGSLVRMVARREQNFLTAMLRGVDTCRLVVDSHQSQMVVLPERDAKPKGLKSKPTEGILWEVSKFVRASSELNPLTAENFQVDFRYSASSLNRPKSSTELDGW